MNIDPQETLGQRIRRLRLEKGMTQSELADGFVTTSMISQVESGKNTPSVELIQHIAKKLQIPLHDLIRNEVEQMENAWKHQLAKVYLLTKQASEAELLLEGLLRLKDLSQSHQIELTVDLAESYYLQKKFEDALKILLPLVEELESITFDDARMLASIYNTTGNIYYKKQSYSNSSYYYRRAYDLTLRFPLFDHLAAKIAYNTGITFQLQGYNQEAEHYLQKAFEYFSRKENLYEIAATMMAQGITYKNMQMYHLASESLSTAYGLFQAIDLKTESYYVKLTKASTITVNENPDLAIEELQDCIHSFQEDRKVADIVYAYSKLAGVQLHAGKLDEALQNLDHASKLIKNNDLSQTLESGECYQVFARYYFTIEEYDLAIEKSLKSSGIFNLIGMIADQVDSLQIACDSYFELGDHLNAFHLERICTKLLKKLSIQRGG